MCAPGQAGEELLNWPMPSAKMFCVKKIFDGETKFLANDGRSWTKSYYEIMWYAYGRYADQRAVKIPGSKVAFMARDYNVCPYGGRKRRT